MQHNFQAQALGEQVHAKVSFPASEVRLGMPIISFGAEATGMLCVAALPESSSTPGKCFKDKDP